MYIVVLDVLSNRYNSHSFHDFTNKLIIFPIDVGNAFELAGVLRCKPYYVHINLQQPKSQRFNNKQKLVYKPRRKAREENKPRIATNESLWT